MSKTPVSILQEIAAKSNIPLPVYTETYSAGVHQNKFIIQVTWNGFKAKGDGTNKKEAKQNAAKEMIQLISKTSPQSGPSLVLPVESVTIDSLEDKFTNYIGVLQQQCQKIGLQDPCYKLLTITGPPHLPNFTVNCTIASEHSEGSGSTKKIAKQNAAKKLLERLKEIELVNMDSMNELQLKYENLKIEEHKFDVAQQNTNVLNIYSRMKEVSVGDNTFHVQYYHCMITELCRTILKSEAYYSIWPHGIEGSHISNTNSIIQVLQDIMKATISVINFQSKKSNQSIIGLRLATKPVLFQISVSDNVEEAKMMSVFKLLEYIRFFTK